MATPALRLAGLRLGFGATAIVGPIDLDVAPGEAVALVGRSGCGKSTLLAAIAGLHEGTLTGAIARADAGPPGMVFQEPTLLPWRSALGNVALPLELAGLDRDEARLRAREALQAVGLKDAAQLRPLSLSIGMRMRTALARALATGAALMLLDEPFAAIDEFGRAELDALLTRLQRERGFAMVIITHALEEAVQLADRVVVLAGRPAAIVGEIAAPKDRTPAAIAEAAAAVRALLAPEAAP